MERADLEGVRIQVFSTLARPRRACPACPACPARVVFGSDYPVFDAGSYAAFLDAFLPLSSAERAQIMGNRWPGWDR